MDDIAQTRCVMLRRSILVLMTPVLLTLAMLACAGTPLTGMPVSICSTRVPLPTATVLDGTPLPLPPPPATPVQIQSPADFYLSDVVQVGSAVQLRLLNVGIHPADATRQVYNWELEVTNTGTVDYEIYPSAQMFLSDIRTPSGEISGIWPSTRAAASILGVTFDDYLHSLPPGEMRLFRFAALAPAGEPLRFQFVLDPTVSEGSPVVSWLNEANPFCGAEVAP